MAASLTMRTGHSKAAAKSKPTQPGPRLPGSLIGPFRPTGPGMPIETPSYFQPRASLRTWFTICEGESSLPEGILRGSVSPVARNFTFDPPMSIDRILEGVFFCFLLRGVALAAQGANG